MSGGALDLDGCAVGQHLGDTLHHFGGIVAHGHDGVGAMFGSVLQQKFEGILARLLAQIGQQRDIATDDGLQRSSQITHNAARSHDNPAHNSKVPDNPVARKFIRRSHHGCVHSIHSASPPAVYRCDSNAHTFCVRAKHFCYAPHVESFFYLLAILQIGTGVYLLWDAVQWLGYARRRLREKPGSYAPRAAVLCPCKGLEPGLERNLAALSGFDYNDYEVFYILASATDPAYDAVKRIAEASRVPAHVIVAEPPQGCGEKVNNLSVAVQQLDASFEVMVFVDSDGRPGKSWLRRLVAPLNDSRIGAVTTMRWLIPSRANLASTLLTLWNASTVTLLREHGRNFCWGGGTAISRIVFEQTHVLEEWSHSVSDDYSMTRALLRGNRPIIFLPDCLTPSFVNTDWPGLLEFTNRQILITRIYSGQTWAAAAITHLLYCATLGLGAYLTLVNVLATLPAFQLAALTFVPILLAAIRNALRIVAVTEVLPAERSQVMDQAPAQILLAPFISFLFLLNFAASLLTRKIRWRGVTYELISPQQTRILAH
jgi:ceramide glucosyltransferase